MPLKRELAEARTQWGLLTIYQKFEHPVILILTALIAIVIVFAVWNLALKILLSIVIALLAIVRKLLILDLASIDVAHLFALAAAILALGGVHWLVRDQDQRERS